MVISSPKMVFDQPESGQFLNPVLDVCPRGQLKNDLVHEYEMVVLQLYVHQIVPH